MTVTAVSLQPTMSDNLSLFYEQSKKRKRFVAFHTQILYFPLAHFVPNHTNLSFLLFVFLVLLCFFSSPPPPPPPHPLSKKQIINAVLKKEPTLKASAHGRLNATCHNVRTCVKLQNKAYLLIYFLINFGLLMHNSIKLP